MKSTSRLSLLGLLLASSLILGFIEHMLPPLTPVPGIKLGLSNIPVVFALYSLDRRDAVLLAAAKTVLSCALFGGFSAFIYSAFGMTASMAAMCVLCGRKDISPLGVSAAGGAAHIASQVAAAVVLTGTVSIWRLLSLFIALGTVSGILNGLIASILLYRLRDITDLK